VLVPIEGKPVVKSMSDARFERVINTQAMIARTRFDSTWYLHLYDGWISSTSLEGPWTRARRAPFGLDDAAKALAKSGTVDLLDGGRRDTQADAGQRSSRGVRHRDPDRTDPLKGQRT
jgi:hypothetical protein